MAHPSLRQAGLRLLCLSPFLGMLLLFTGAAPAAVAPQPGAFRECPEPGQGGDPALHRLNNRSAPAEAPQALAVAQINALPLPLEALRGKRATWPARTRSEVSPLEQTGVMVEGVLIGAKPSGTESTNGQRQELRDDHLWMVDAQDHTRAQAVVAEVTPRWLASNPGWRLRFLKRLADQRARVRLTGWRMLDPEHIEQLGQTRGGLRDIHPITKIEVFSGGQWVEL